MAKLRKQKEFEIAEKGMNDLLAIATKKGGFNFLTKKENEALLHATEEKLRKEFWDKVNLSSSPASSRKSISPTPSRHFPVN